MITLIDPIDIFLGDGEEVFEYTYPLFGCHSLHLQVSDLTLQAEAYGGVTLLSEGSLQTIDIRGGSCCLGGLLCAGGSAGREECHPQEKEVKDSFHSMDMY